MPIRLIANLLIVFVLFTHSGMAMDMHFAFSDNTTQPNQPEIAASEKVVSGQPVCTDAGGHCSHHQAHTTGLFSVAPFSEMQSKHVLFHIFQVSLTFTDLIPPRRPPRT